jgi:hypothetical protein
MGLMATSRGSSHPREAFPAVLPERAPFHSRRSKSYPCPPPWVHPVQRPGSDLRSSSMGIRVPVGYWRLWWRSAQKAPDDSREDYDEGQAAEY